MAGAFYYPPSTIKDVSTPPLPDPMVTHYWPVAAILTLLTGCSHLVTGMDSHTLRTAIDNCKSNDLDVLAYQRPDGSIMAIRCIPRKSDIAKTITIRPRMPMPVIRLFSDKYQMEEQ